MEPNSHRGRLYTLSWSVSDQDRVKNIFCTPVSLPRPRRLPPTLNDAPYPIGCQYSSERKRGRQSRAIGRFNCEQSDAQSATIDRDPRSIPMSDPLGRTSPHDAHGQTSPAEAGGQRKLWIRDVEDVRSDVGHGGGSPTRISPVKLFRTPERDQQRGGKRGAGDWHDSALELCAGLKRILGEDVLGVGTEMHFSQFRTRSTVGIMLRGAVIDNLVVGGPAHASRSLHKVTADRRPLERKFQNLNPPGLNTTATQLPGWAGKRRPPPNTQTHNPCAPRHTSHTTHYTLHPTLYTLRPTP